MSIIPSQPQNNIIITFKDHSSLTFAVNPRSLKIKHSQSICKKDGQLFYDGKIYDNIKTETTMGSFSITLLDGEDYFLIRERLNLSGHYFAVEINIEGEKHIGHNIVCSNIGQHLEFKGELERK